jgi:hypothetical protein
MNDEVLEFANKIGAIDLKKIFDLSEFRGLFKRRNYFLINKNIFLIIKISRSKEKSFWGFGEKFLDFFNKITENQGNYYFVALVSNKDGWVISKEDILNLIANGSLSYSAKQGEYKINEYNLRTQNNFTSIRNFLNKIGLPSPVLI